MVIHSQGKNFVPCFSPLKALLFFPHDEYPQKSPCILKGPVRSCWSPIGHSPCGGEGKAHQIWWVLRK